MCKAVGGILEITQIQTNKLKGTFCGVFFLQMAGLFIHILSSSYSATFSFPFKTIYIRDSPFVILLCHSTLATGETRIQSPTERVGQCLSSSKWNFAILLPTHWLPVILVSEVLMPPSSGR